MMKVIKDIENKSIRNQIVNRTDFREDLRKFEGFYENISPRSVNSLRGHRSLDRLKKDREKVEPVGRTRIRRHNKQSKNV